MRLLKEVDVRDAFLEAQSYGNAILAFANHDWRDMKPDVEYVQDLLRKIRDDFPEVLIRYAGAEEAATAMIFQEANPPLELGLELRSNQIYVEVIKGKIFGPQPFLAIQSKSGEFFHDNFDIVDPLTRWTYCLDEQTLPMDKVDSIGVGAAGRHGTYSVKKIKF
jgi:hypothetical protein